MSSPSVLQQMTQQNVQLFSNVASVPSLAFAITSVVIGYFNLGNSCDYNIAALLIATGSLSLASGLLNCVQHLYLLRLPEEQSLSVMTISSCVSCPLGIGMLAMLVLQIMNLYCAWDTRTQCGVHWYAMTLYVIFPVFCTLLFCVPSCSDGSSLGL